MATFAKGDVVQVTWGNRSIWCLATVDEVGTKEPITYSVQLDDPDKGYFGPLPIFDSSNIRQPPANVLTEYRKKQEAKAKYKPGALVQVQVDLNDPKSWVTGEYLGYTKRGKFQVKYLGQTSDFDEQYVKEAPEDAKQRFRQLNELNALLKPGDPIEVQITVPDKGLVWASGTFKALIGEKFYVDYFWSDPTNRQASGTKYFEYESIRLPVPAGQDKKAEEPDDNPQTGEPPQPPMDPGAPPDSPKTSTSFAGIPFDTTRAPYANNPYHDKYPRIVPLVKDNTLYICWQDMASPTIYLHRMATDSNKLLQVAQLPSLGLLGGCTIDNSGHFYILTINQEMPANSYPNSESPNVTLEDAKKQYNITFPIEMSRQKKVAKIYKLDPNGKLLKEVDLNQEKYTDAPLYGMLNWGTGRLAYGNGMIAALFSRRSYSDNDKLFHQISAFMTLDENLEPVSKAAHTRVSHSFDQRLIFDGDSFVLLHEGDTYPNPGLLIQKATLSPTEDGQKRVQLTTRTPYTCPTDANKTYINVGNVAVGKNGYVLVFASSQHQQAPTDMLADMAMVHVVKGFENVAQPDARKIGRDLVDSQGIQEGFNFSWFNWNPKTSRYDAPESATISRNVIWFPDDQAYQDTRPKLAKIGDDKFVAIWERWPRGKKAYESTWAVVLSEMGVVRQPLKKVCDARLNPGDDAFTWQGKAAWLTGDALNKQINLHLVDENLNCSTTTLDLMDTPAPPSAKDVQTAELYENQWVLSPQEAVEYEFKATPGNVYQVNVVSDALDGKWTIKEASQSEANKKELAIVKSVQAMQASYSITTPGTYHIKVQGADANAQGAFSLNILPNPVTLGNKGDFHLPPDNAMALTFNAKAGETYRIRLQSSFAGVLKAGEQSFSITNGQTINYVSPTQEGAYKLELTKRSSDLAKDFHLSVDLMIQAKLGDNRGTMEGSQAVFLYKATLNNGYVITPFVQSSPHFRVNDAHSYRESAAVFAEGPEVTIERTGDSSGDPYDFNLTEIEAPAAPGSTNPITINGLYRGHCIVKNGGTVTYNLTIKPNTTYEFYVGNVLDHAQFSVNGADSSWGLYTLPAGSATNCQLIVGPISFDVDDAECCYCYEVKVAELPGEAGKLAEGVTNGIVPNNTPTAYKFEAQPQTAYKISAEAVDFKSAVFTIGDTKLAQVGNEFVGYFYNDSGSAKTYDVQVSAHTPGQTGAFTVKIYNLGRPRILIDTLTYSIDTLTYSGEPATYATCIFKPVATKVYKITAVHYGGGDPALIVNNVRTDLSASNVETCYFYADTAVPCLIILEGGLLCTLSIKQLN